MAVINDIINRETIEIFNKIQTLETREDMIDYLRSLPRKDEDI